jgi:hypothetical protein
MKLVAENIGGAFNPTGDWDFRLDQSVPMRDITGRLGAIEITPFPGAHAGINYQGKINGRWYHLILISTPTGENIMESHFELNKPFSIDHAIDDLTGQANWRRPSDEECDRRKKNSN